MWEKKGLILPIASFQSDEIVSHASIPFALHLQNDDFRIFFSARDQQGRSHPYFIDCLIQNGEITLTSAVSSRILNLGEKGTFDDNGIMPSSIVHHQDQLWMYYIGWNPQLTVSYRLSIGLAISEDNGNTWKKFSQGPLLDRSYHEPFFNTAPFVIKDNECWRMFYVSCTGWIEHEGRMEPLYNVKQSTSMDGIHWQKPGIEVVPYSSEAESIGRPCVVKVNSGYEIYFSHRMARDYRLNPLQSYKIGCAQSMDALNWNQFQFDILQHSEKQDWDDQMNEYCHVFIHKGIKYMIYNGNGFGVEGFGYCIKKEVQP
jgi:hypothetical protein